MVYFHLQHLNFWQHQEIVNSINESSKIATFGQTGKYKSDSRICSENLQKTSKKCVDFFLGFAKNNLKNYLRLNSSKNNLLKLKSIYLLI